MLSFEVFPPKTTTGIETIYRTLGELRGLKPDFISVTYGAGGSADCDATLDIARYVQSVCGVKAVAHMPCLYMTKQKAYDVLVKFKAAGIRDILALGGNRFDGIAPAGDFCHASDLVSFIKEFEDSQHTGGLFEICGACYPEKHPDSPDVISDIRMLKIKTDAGVSKLISQLFFDNTVFYEFLEHVRMADISVPVEAGIMPVINKKQIERMTDICGASLPVKFRKIMDKYGDNPDAMRDAGIAYAIDQIVDLAANGVDDIHLYTMNNAYVAHKIYDAVNSLLQKNVSVQQDSVPVGLKESGIK